ncbi:MAG: nucleotidyltransferase domain-containing protein [Candidatus Melainabacteria bacterium]|nr:nucleotidyltransferase domain-containing protein [Candidatus Melainabacteria bacterium]
MLEVFTDKKLNKIITDYLSKLEGKITIDKAILYGSYAKGTATELSDIDLLIISKDLPKDRLKGMNGYYLDTLVGEFNPSLEVIAIHPNKLNHPITKGFFEEIINTGKLILGR